MSWLERAEVILRFKAGKVDSWAKRGIAEQEAMAGLREHPGFPAFLDSLDAELANIFMLWRRADPKEEVLLRDLHARARVMGRVIELLEQTTTARDKAKEAEQQILEAERVLRAHNAHNARRRSAVEAAQAMAEMKE